MLDQAFWEKYMRDEYHPIVSRLEPHNALTKRCVNLVEAFDRQHARYVDVGCGTGIVTEAMVKRFPDAHIVAIDRYDAGISVAKTRLKGESRVTFIQDDASATLHVANDSVDGIIALHSVYTMPYPERFVALAAKALKVGGKLVIANPWRTDARAVMAEQMEHLKHAAGERAEWEALGPVLEAFIASNRRIADESGDAVRFIPAQEMRRLLINYGLSVFVCDDAAYAGNDVLIGGMKHS